MCPMHKGMLSPSFLSYLKVTIVGANVRYFCGLTQFKEAKLNYAIANTSYKH